VTKKLFVACLAGIVTLGAGVESPTPSDAPTSFSLKPSTKSATPKFSVARNAEDDSKDEPSLHLNFRAAPLDTVLSYLSEAAGYTIVLKTALRGTVDVFSEKPLTKAEALQVLNIALAKNGLASIQNGRTLTILSQEDAKKALIRVRSGSKPEAIPVDDEMVTQIMPLSHVNAAQLLKDLEGLLPANADVSSNESGNVIVMTDTQANIHHFAEIVEAIDTSISAVAGIKVYPLHYADSKAVSQVIKDLFAPDTSSAASSRGGSGASPFAGILSRFGGGAAGGATGGSSRGSSSRGPTASRVVTVSDDRSNSVVVTAPDDVMSTIDDLIKAIDINVEDLTEIRVFRLKYADPNEVANLLSNLFPDDTTKNGASGTPGSPTSRFGSPFANPFGAAPAGGAGQSDRAKKMARVIAVPDPRTVSVVITTSHDIMKQIEMMITNLDNNKGKNQVVKVYPLDNADAQQVQQVLQDLFQSTQSNNRNRNSANQNSPLTTRATTQVQSQGTSGSTTTGSRGGKSGP
jgi:general secretion pathway protein D